MSISTTVSWLFRSINECFRFFQGIYFSLGFNIVALIVAGYGVLAVMRMITNGNLSISKTIDVPREDRSVRSGSGWSSSGDTNQDVSKE